MPDGADLKSGSMLSTKVIQLAGALKACAAAVDAAPNGEIAKRVQLLPLGKIDTRDGRTYFLRTKADAAQVIATTRARLGKLELPGDYDHQTDYGAKDGVGGQAPASGWIDPATLTVEDDGIWGDVTWTGIAEAKLKAREYRYLSPVFAHNKAGDVLAILRFALTNTPAIEELAAVAAIQETEEDMSLKAIAKLLGLDETADEATVTASVKSLQAGSVAVASALGLAATASSDELVSAASAAKTSGDPDPSKFVPIDAFRDLQRSVAALQDGQVEDKATAAVDQALAAGKLTPAQKSWALAYAKKDLKGFTEDFVATAAVVVTPGRHIAGQADGHSDANSLTDAEKAVCRAIGQSEEVFLATKKADLAERIGA